MLKIAGRVMVLFVAVEHVWFMVLEAYFWRRPLGLKTFGLTQEFADASASLAMNQGLYNGFLAAGLIWALTTLPAGESERVQLFFLACVAIAGLVGGLTAKMAILVIQGAPAVVAFALVWLSR